jgi:hypothetical protein
MLTVLHLTLFHFLFFNMYPKPNFTSPRRANLVHWYTCQPTATLQWFLSLFNCGHDTDNWVPSLHHQRSSMDHAVKSMSFRQTQSHTPKRHLVKSDTYDDIWAPPHATRSSPSYYSPTTDYSSLPLYPSSISWKESTPTPVASPLVPAALIGFGAALVACSIVWYVHYLCHKMRSVVVRKHELCEPISPTTTTTASSPSDPLPRSVLHVAELDECGEQNDDDVVSRMSTMTASVEEYPVLSNENENGMPVASPSVSRQYSTQETTDVSVASSLTLPGSGSHPSLGDSPSSHAEYSTDTHEYDGSGKHPSMNDDDDDEPPITPRQQTIRRLLEISSLTHSPCTSISSSDGPGRHWVESDMLEEARVLDFDPCHDEYLGLPTSHDPHEDENNKDRHEGEFVRHLFHVITTHVGSGLGLDVTSATCAATHPLVMAVHEHSPWKGRVFPGDYVLVLNDHDLAGMTQYQVHEWWQTIHVQQLKEKHRLMEHIHQHKDHEDSVSPESSRGTTTTTSLLIKLTVMSSHVRDGSDDELLLDLGVPESALEI